ncbi:LSM domain-containing protein [Aureibacillus halotolerans]|uniref:LSM domain-containing protein n=1 Tax=Aureibacillus halotolerans TaxID=1508390 RepID=A0A4R6U732_9BACI|nr:LSM domain-containing protein [Aureibacillus halotolerans]TDQ41482.1 LSM domain-containing protein [Aureibacillus halotolerans]
MSFNHYQTCCQHQGRPVHIRCKNGREYRGIIQNVDRQQVFIQPIGGAGGFGYGFFGYGGYGYGAGLGIGIALGSIATIALLPFFW